eukprot:gnl/TRDRNA2_/TRDRNA2_180768_c0_seq1.p1 gnl/TRDRNA2_/TRDRNA2_180768_c0~~gnl/TRDRNA2_/TRDRNA2_180768_c0_seq1.p1  ORF type:complete len:222 (+),score=48.18 gnl/TRDRNA2_/TRDRNA2_180768_c0_seq1:59-724(+)
MKMVQPILVRLLLAVALAVPTVGGNRTVGVVRLRSKSSSKGTFAGVAENTAEVSGNATTKAKAKASVVRAGVANGTVAANATRALLRSGSSKETSGTCCDDESECENSIEVGPDAYDDVMAETTHVEYACTCIATKVVLNEYLSDPNGMVVRIGTTGNGPSKEINEGSAEKRLCIAIVYIHDYHPGEDTCAHWIKGDDMEDMCEEHTNPNYGEEEEEEPMP